MKPESKTAYFCCGARMVDAQSKHPVCNDTYAAVFMNDEGRDVFERFKPFANAMISNATRHRIIDDLLREELKRDPKRPCILIGAGFDTRAYRIQGGSWIELDDPELIRHKNECLPSSECTNPLLRIPHDMTRDSISASLSVCSILRPPVIIIEGVLIYLAEEEISRLLKELRDLIPEHILICDLQTYRFFRQFNMKFQQVLNSFGASLRITSETPENVFLSHRYRIREKIPILDRTMQYASLTMRQKLVKLALRTIYRDIKDGYSVYCFSCGS